jgi:uncharacterized protein YqjF (DUF2071 family)
MWDWVQDWRDLLFLHWQFSDSAVRTLLPDGLELDTRDGGAWVSLVLFRMNVRARGLPSFPGVSSFQELNLRTYVRRNCNPGIWFLRLYADNRWAIRLARTLTPLPYRWMRLVYEESDGAYSCYDSESDKLSLQFQPVGAPKTPNEESLDSWLLERYRAFAPSGQKICEGEVLHDRWSVREVELSVAANHVGHEWGLDLSRRPDAVHFADGFQARFRAFRPV